MEFSGCIILWLIRNFIVFCWLLWCLGSENNEYWEYSFLGGFGKGFSERGLLLWYDGCVLGVWVKIGKFSLFDIGIFGLVLVVRFSFGDSVIMIVLFGMGLNIGFSFSYIFW